MLPLNTADSVKACILHLSNALPENWERVIVYAEFLRSASDQDIESMDVAEYIAGGRLVRDFQMPMNAYTCLRELFLACEASGQDWAGLRIEARREGDYRSNFYYEGYPLLDGNMEEIRVRLKGEP